MLRIFYLGLVLASLSGSMLLAAPRSSSSSAPRGADLDFLRHELANHETELQMLSERLNNQEALMDTLREDIGKSQRTTQEAIKGSGATTTSRLTHLEASFSEMQQQLSQLKSSSQQLEKGLTAILQALQLSDSTAAQTHRVSEGENLEKIAKKYQTTVKAIREANQLKNDRIYTGQKLAIPQ